MEAQPCPHKVGNIYFLYRKCWGPSQSQNASRGARGSEGDRDLFKVTELGVRPQFCVSCCCDDPRMGGRDPLRPAWAELAAVWISLVDAWVWDARGDKMGEGHQLVALGGEGAGALGAQVRGGHQESAATAAGGQGPKRLLEGCSMRTAARNRGVGGEGKRPERLGAPEWGCICPQHGGQLAEDGAEGQSLHGRDLGHGQQKAQRRGSGVQGGAARGVMVSPQFRGGTRPGRGPSPWRTGGWSRSHPGRSPDRAGPLGRARHARRRRREHDFTATGSSSARRADRAHRQMQLRVQGDQSHQEYRP